MTTELSAQEKAQQIWNDIDREDDGPKAGEQQSVESQEQEEGAATAAPETRTETPEQGTANEPPDEEDDRKALRQKIAGLEAIINQFSGRLRNAEGHIGGLNSQIKQQIEAARTATSTGSDAPTVKEIQAAQGNPQALAELEREYPEFSKALRPALDETVRSEIAALEERMKAAKGNADDSMTRAEFNERVAEIEASAQVEAKHSGWKQTVKGADFIGFVESGPRELKLLAASDEPADAIRLLDRYVESKKPAPATTKSTQRLSAAAAMPTGSRSQVRSKNVDDMTPQEYWEYQDQLDRQQSKG